MGTLISNGISMFRNRLTFLGFTGVQLCEDMQDIVFPYIILKIFSECVRACVRACVSEWFNAVSVFSGEKEHTENVRPI